MRIFFRAPWPRRCPLLCAGRAFKAQAVAAYTYYSHLRSQQRSNPDEA